MDWTTLILALITALLGSGNIWQLVNNRQLKRKLNAEGEQEEIKSLRLIIDGNVQEIQRLQQRVDDYSTKYDALWQKYLELQAKIEELTK